VRVDRDDLVGFQPAGDQHPRVVLDQERLGGEEHRVRRVVAVVHVDADVLQSQPFEDRQLGRADLDAAAEQVREVRLRHRADAVGIGVEKVRADDPQQRHRAAG
jgi:riboflavin biosynthesis pyrimidine reductase